MQAQFGMQGPASPYGNCDRCGAPKAPLMLNGGGIMIACTKCTTKEQQDDQLRFSEMAKRISR